MQLKEIDQLKEEIKQILTANKAIEVKSISLKNKTSIGGWMQTTEPMIAELLGQRNFDWIVLDIEHGTFDTSKLQNVFRAIELNNKLPLVRLANHDKKVLGQLFDSGCCGVIIPNITSSKDLENIIKSCSWPPNGSRGVGFSRSNLFGLKFNQYKKIAQKPFIVAMIENLKALKNLFKLKNKFYAVTLGEKGVMWIENHQVYLCKPLKIKVVETNGAGDVFHGAFAYSVDQNNDISHAIKFATAAATLKCTKKGGTRTLPSLSSVNKLAAKLKIIKVHI